jgi:hypothetical protein
MNVKKSKVSRSKINLTNLRDLCLLLHKIFQNHKVIQIMDQNLAMQEEREKTKRLIVAEPKLECLKNKSECLTH